MSLELCVRGGDPRWVAASARLASDCAARLGLAVAECETLGLAVEEACHNVLAHAYEPGEEIRYQVTLEEREGALQVGVVDQGITFSLTRLTNPVFGQLDSVRLYRLGRAGKRLELVKQLPAAWSALESAGEAPADSPVSSAPVTVRPARPDDAVAIARCVYRCYGRSYGSQYLYMPERLKRLWELGLVTSVVAESEGEVVGHLLYWLDGVQDQAGQATDAVVEPCFRGRHLFEEMKRLLIEETRAQGRLGMISEAVTVHPYTQKGVLALGAVETGLMLGDLPADLQFKGIENQLPARQSCMLCYMRLNPEPHRTVYLPAGHRAMLERIYAKVGLNRSFGEGAALEGHTELESHVDNGWHEALLRVTRCGTDVASVLEAAVHHVLSQGSPYLYLELPLGSPGVEGAVAAAESLGFSFAGLVPEAHEGDVLRLHYVAHLEVDPAIATASDWGAELRDYVQAAVRR